VSDGTILGIDLGRRRIGVAIADVGGLAARPLDTIALPRRTPGAAPAEGARAEGTPAEGAPAAGGQAGWDEPALAAIAELVRRHDTRELVVGLPLELRGAEGEMAAWARDLANRLRASLGIPVTLRDERLSSSVAEARLGAMPRGRSGGPPSRTQRERYRARVDREAAAIILQDELNARARAGASR